MSSSRGSRAESAAGSRHRRRTPRALLAISMLVLVAVMLFAVAAPAMADNTISGIVVDSTTVVAPSTTTTVVVFDLLGNFVTTASDLGHLGTYTTPTLATGTYRVQFMNAAYVTQWWDNMPLQSLATSVVVGTTPVTGINASLVLVAPVLPTTAITAPALGAGPYAPGSTLTVNWTTSSAVTSGSFGIWVRAGDGTYLAPRTTVLATTARIGTTTNYTANITIPTSGWAGAGNHVIVARSAADGGGAWVANSWATSPGSFTVTGATAQALTVTQPSGLGGMYATTDDLTVDWSMAQSSASGTFDIWVRSASGSSWYKLNGPVTGSATLNYTATLALNDFTPAVPAGLGYQAIVRYTPGTGTVLWGTSPATFQVTGASSTFPTISISTPAPPTVYYAQSSTVGVSWTTNDATLPGTGHFGIWARNSATNVYYAYHDFSPTLGITAYNYDLALTGVPDGTYQVVMAYRGPALGAWGGWATSPGSFNVTAVAPSAVVMHAPYVRDTSINVTGAGFTGATLVTFTSGATVVTAVPSVVNDGSLNVTIPHAALLAANTLTVTGPGGTSAASAPFTVVAGTATKYLVTSSSYAPVAGQPVTITATLVDVNDNPVGAGTATVTWSKSGANGSFAAATSTCVAGVATVVFTTHTTIQNTTVTGTDGASLTGTSSLISPIAGSGTKYVVTPATVSPVAGATDLISAQFTDANGNSVSTAGLVVTWTKTNANGSFATATSTTNASGLATVLFTTHTVSGTATTITATDSGALTGTSATITTVAGVATKYLVTSDSYSLSLGGAHTPTITAQLADVNNNAVSTSGRLVQWTYQTLTDAAAGTFASATSTTDGSGVATVVFTATGLGTLTITGTDTITTSWTGVTPTITIST